MTFERQDLFGTSVHHVGLLCIMRDDRKSRRVRVPTLGASDWSTILWEFDEGQAQK